MVSRLRTIIATGTILLCVTVLGETEPEQDEPASDETSVAAEKHSDSENLPEDGETSDGQADEESPRNDKEGTDSETGETYTRLPIQTRINPNQDVDLPQDI